MRASWEEVEREAKKDLCSKGRRLLIALATGSSTVSSSRSAMEDRRRQRLVREAYVMAKNLVGPIPPEIGNCKSLTTIDLSLNFFSGVIPFSFGNLIDLQELMLSNNNLSGSIPPVLSNCTNLIQLQLDRNTLSG
ncbi:hypothetical protein L2E82_06569 [Cichorium intybus]|uniref:Uncharacterized protein n=1 Tax=Cichorium intybus TaxID=13427 RepID=A0ACB9HB06_CICIN|nr:hypothetical protein L2E82_06569 [Cichorium intybus]